MINNHSKNNHNNKNSQINKNNIPGRPARSNVAAHNEHSVDTRELALEMLIEINESVEHFHISCFAACLTSISICQSRTEPL